MTRQLTSHIVNPIALTKLEEGAMWLHKRTRDRMARNVEGTLKV